MRKTSTALLALALAGASVTGLASSATADPAPLGLSAIGLVGDDKLVRIDLAEGGKTRGGPRVTGLIGDDTGLVGIDFRPQDGKLYGVGNGGGVYTLAEDGVATYVNELSVSLSGSTFGVDFNPAADRLRIVSDTGQNLRHNVNAGGVTINDTNIGRSVQGVAYTNNDINPATGTVIYYIDATADELVTSAAPNTGPFTTVAPLGTPTGPVVGFDISGTTTAFAVLTSETGSDLVGLDLATGATTALGTLDKAVTDLAVVYNQ